MERNANLHICIDPETKAGAEQLFATFGITVTDAIIIFLRQSLLVGGLPFDVRGLHYNAETETAMQEARDIMDGKIQTNESEDVIGENPTFFSTQNEIKDGSSPKNDGTLVVYGYTEWSLVTPKMKIYLNGDYYGDVSHRGRTSEIPITKPTEVKIKCSIRSTTIRGVLPNKRNEIRTEFDRLTGKIIFDLKSW